LSKQSLNQSLLYFIAAQHPIPGRSLVDVTAQALAGGVDVVQLREKDLPEDQVLDIAGKLAGLIQSYGKLFLINRYLDVALAVGAHGVHLGYDGPTPREARRILGPAAIIGASVHSLEEADKAVDEGADYLLVSHIFPTNSKPGVPPNGLKLLHQVQSNYSQPVIALGGINLNNVNRVVAAGCSRIAVMSALLKAVDVEAEAKAIKDKLILKHD